MADQPLIVLGAFVLIYGLFSARFDHAIVTPPMVLVGFAMIVCPNVLDRAIRP
jgi:hypothetical protein